jgi:hypothetical protein
MTMYTTQSFLALSTQNPGATAGNAFISASTEYAKATTIENYLSNKVDQTDPLMSRATMLLIERIVQTGVMPAILLFGVTFNVINIAVFLRQGLQDRVTLCLFFLAVSDTCYMLSLMSFRGYSIVELFDKEFGEYWKARMVFMVGIYHVFADSSDCITMLIAVERCVCVLLPLKVKTWLSIAKIRAYIAVVVIACVPTNLIFCFKYNVISFPDPVTNATRYKTGMTEFMIHYPFLPRMHEIVNIVVPVAAFAVVIASTILISVRMRNVLSWRQNTSNRSVTAQKERREAAVTRMLTVICIIFTVCLIPYVLSAFFRLSVPDYNPEGNSFKIVFK